MSQINGILRHFPTSVQIVINKLQITCYTCHIFHIPFATNLVFSKNSCPSLADVSIFNSKPLHYIQLCHLHFWSSHKCHVVLLLVNIKLSLGLNAYDITKVYGRVEIYTHISPKTYASIHYTSIHVTSLHFIPHFHFPLLLDVSSPLFENRSLLLT